MINGINRYPYSDKYEYETYKKIIDCGDGFWIVYVKSAECAGGGDVYQTINL